MARVRLEPSWKALLADQFDAPYMQQLREFLLSERQAGKIIYPPGAQMFAALDATPVDRVRVVIIGQDPYHGPGQAHGLCFSVQDGVPHPPSLRNIFIELQRDFGHPIPRHGCLQAWAQQGVLLLNSVLSVERFQAASHAGKGWEQFTDCIIERLAQQRAGLVFMLWGSYAQRKAAVVDGQRHLLLKAPHPSPLSAHRGFIGCAHFSKANAYLLAQGAAPVDWRLGDVPGSDLVA